MISLNWDKEGVKNVQNYRTIGEKAAEWNLSSRHIQYLCRNGEIQGAIKRAGSWFLPDDTPSPAKNSKSGNSNFKYVGTKKKVFDSAIELFMLNGIDNVSIRDIAEHVGIRQSTIYNHFKSKQEILDAIYGFYCHYYTQYRPSLEEMEERLKNESLIEIIGSIRYGFNEEYQQKMSDIAKIIFQRIGIDDRAREICKSLMVDEGIKYVETIFNRAIEIGRFAPFDTHTMAVFINSIQIVTLFNWIIAPSPGNMMELLKEEQELYEYAAGFIKVSSR